MELSLKITWLLLALVHFTPALSFFVPRLGEKLYGTSADGDISILLTHRGALFLAVLVVSIYAIFEPGARRAASLVAAISMLAFLILYARAGMPDGPLRKIALVDFIGLVPLAWVCWQAWRLPEL